jgi:hypothetical protein
VEIQRQSAEMAASHVLDTAAKFLSTAAVGMECRVKGASMEIVAARIICADMICIIVEMGADASSAIVGSQSVR